MNPLTSSNLFDAIREYVNGDIDRANEVVSCLASVVGWSHPVSKVQWVPIEKVEPNDYNPNTVAKVEMKLLDLSITEDGYTQPVVTYYDQERDKYVIVDGFHRYFVMKANPRIASTTGGRLPVVVIEKSISERMASTVRHNRARGKHTVMGMASLVDRMGNDGCKDAEICNALGLEPQELHRLRCKAGIAHLFAKAEYSNAWETIGQIRIRREYKEQEVGGTGNGKDHPRQGTD